MSQGRTLGMRDYWTDLDIERILLIALADSIAWAWFLQTAYASRFSAQIEGIRFFSQPQLDITFWISLIAGLVLVCLRWDRIPRIYRILCPIVAASSVGILLLISVLDVDGMIIELLATGIFIVSYIGCQFLRIETLAKSTNRVGLAITVFCSFVLYYVISIVLLIIPLPAYFTFVVVAPCIFLVYFNRPLESTENPRSISLRSFIILPNLLLVFLGVAGGILAADGNTNTAQNLSTVFEQPSPVYLLMVLVFMVLGILISFNYRYKMGMLFALLNIIWIVGTLLGVLIKSLLPDIPSSLFVVLASIAGLAVVASFVVFQDAWLRDGRGAKSDEGNQVEEQARKRGLTKREVEVLSLLLEGRSVPYIQKLLYISEGTARTHTKHIYTKLGVHTKQDLIDLFK
jgi:DNA-binding CsgD family transcriptional regulator